MSDQHVTQKPTKQLGWHHTEYLPLFANRHSLLLPAVSLPHSSWQTVVDTDSASLCAEHTDGFMLEQQQQQLKYKWCQQVKPPSAVACPAPASCLVGQILRHESLPQTGQADRPWRRQSRPHNTNVMSMITTVPGADHCAAHLAVDFAHSELPLLTVTTANV